MAPSLFSNIMMTKVKTVFLWLITRKITTNMICTYSKKYIQGSIIILKFNVRMQANVGMFIFNSLLVWHNYKTYLFTLMRGLLAWFATLKRESAAATISGTRISFVLKISLLMKFTIESFIWKKIFITINSNFNMFIFQFSYLFKLIRINLIFFHKALIWFETHARRHLEVTFTGIRQSSKNINNFLDYKQN